MAKETDESLDAGPIAVSIAKVWRTIAGAEPPAEGEDDPWAEAFEKAASRAIVIFGDANEHRNVEISVNDLATMMARAFCRSQGCDALPLADMPPRARFAWMAVARHAANLLDLDPKDKAEIPVHEGKICEWAAKQILGVR